MTLVRFPDGEVMDVPDALAARLVTSQAEYAEMERDFTLSRELLALAIFRDEVAHYRFTIGDAFHPTLAGKRCAMCEGLFPKRGECIGVTMPKSLGGDVKPLHTHCFLGASAWL